MFKRTRARAASSKINKINSLKPLSHDYHEYQNKVYNAQQSFDRYVNLAREALTMGDRVIAEGYYQHAEHYLRLINGVRQASAQTSAAQVINPQVTSVEPLTTQKDLEENFKGRESSRRTTAPREKSSKDGMLRGIINTPLSE